MRLAGGVGDAQHVTAEVASMVAPFETEILARIDGVTTCFEPMSFATQVVAGTNYFVKIRVNAGTNEHVHVRIFCPLPCTGQPPQLHESFQYPKSEDDAVHAF
eukprot:CAMPEP_0185836382 /NCGR_PEP_ID=MMETSP1353-20130828/9603_1 /TAXON_ID=1077150 /ORGANISM="Erythrolobus australicus, Strain CCMP3124" /LENGTH=102 /DNA_ID=CAMNT_0028535165 /DNA_START=12 /DNA_END=320 /DNA_ORIENTATION=-